jgi:transglutaminase-like putative cysteine protease
MTSTTTTRKTLSDADHPTVQATAERLTNGATSTLDVAEQIFLFVRDDIPFGFPPVWDDVSASQTLALGRGYCTTKATLFHALARAAGITTRLHVGLMGKEILHGIVPAPMYLLLGPVASHTWIELEVDGQWRPLDSYIVDEPLCRYATRQLAQSGRSTGWLLSTATGPTSCEFNFGELGFTQMGAVRDDHGVWDDFADYITTDEHVEMSPLQTRTWPMTARMLNRRLDRMRARA